MMPGAGRCPLLSALLAKLLLYSAELSPVAHLDRLSSPPPSLSNAMVTSSLVAWGIFYYFPSFSTAVNSHNRYLLFNSVFFAFKLEIPVVTAHRTKQTCWGDQEGWTTYHVHSHNKVSISCSSSCRARWKI